MEFVNKTRQYTENTNNMYYQNNTTDDTCYFENRLTTNNNSNIPTTITPGSYSKQFTNTTTTENDITNRDDLITNNIPSHYEVLIDNVNNTNNTNMINISDSYKPNENEVNFNFNDYSKNYSVDPSLLLSENNYQLERSVTNNNIYQTPDFWTQQVPDIITNEYLVRDIPRYFYDRSVERFALPKSTDTIYNNSEFNVQYIEPKVNKNYVTSYITKDNKTVHEGNPKKSKNLKYKQNVNYTANLDEGMIVYYDDNMLRDYDSNFNVTRERVRLQDSNYNKYNKFKNNNEYKTDLTPHNQNIILRRDDQYVAAINYTMKND